MGVTWGQPSSRIVAIRAIRSSDRNASRSASVRAFSRVAVERFRSVWVISVLQDRGGPDRGAVGNLEPQGKSDEEEAPAEHLLQVVQVLVVGELPFGARPVRRVLVG